MQWGINVGSVKVLVISDGTHATSISISNRDISWERWLGATKRIVGQHQHLSTVINASSARVVYSLSAIIIVNILLMETYYEAQHTLQNIWRVCNKQHRDGPITRPIGTGIFSFQINMLMLYMIQREKVKILILTCVVYTWSLWK